MSLTKLVEEKGEDFDVCSCNGVCLGEIADAIKAGTCDLDELVDETDAGTTCEMCISKENDPDGDYELHLDEILAEATKEGICKA